MKRFLIGCFALFILFGCQASESGTMIKTDVDEVLRRVQVEGENSFLLVLTADACYACDEYEKVVEEMQQSKPFDIYYIDIDDEGEQKMEELKIIIGDVTTLPMTYYFDHGELKLENIKQNYIELETYREWLKSLKIY